MKLKPAFTSMFVFSAVILGACGNTQETSEEAESTHEEHVSGDLREETASADSLPKFLADKPDDMKILYQAAAQHQELLENIPCYCGCGESAGHTSNYDCFVHDNKENGAVVWDDHGTRCGVCLEIAAESITDYSKGKSIKEIRQNIDEKYKEGYAKPTLTPGV
ncbi:PCYCGC motif-containing (lipo)protein [Bacillus songklensis]|uniref:PCYCGC motif-containing (Lipo)protein n=1 Tax=Bacillus songklensis TaxID=1069116 RepID=A0ABV8B6K8_9BACI